MKTRNKMGFIPLLLTLLLVVMMAVPTMSTAAQPTVNLRSTSTFAVLAGTTITNTGPTTISGGVPEGGGNVGVSPDAAFTGQADVTMTGWNAHLADAIALQAKADLTLAYDDAAGRTPFETIIPELGGRTLFPGIYRSESGFQITGTLTLNANGDPNAVFVFQSGSMLNTASGSKIILENGARYCRVFWKVTSSATLGTNSVFVGHIFALTSIAAQTGATIQGQLLARNGAVTLDHNTITNGLCETTTPTTTPTPTPTPTATATAATATAIPAPTVTGGKVVTSTVPGGQLPKTSTHLYELLLIGAVLTLVGAVGLISRKRYE
jgi:LPXTG-motif cell wall-anchored protein